MDSELLLLTPFRGGGGGGLTGQQRTDQNGRPCVEGDWWDDPCLGCTFQS